MYIFELFKSFALKTLRHLGYDIRKVDKANPQSPYELICPVASYAPWNKDGAFLEIYSKIKNRTLVDKYRCYELWSLVEQSKKLAGALIEIGVWRGGTGVIIATKAHLAKINDPVYLCDTFSGVVKASMQDSTYKGGEHADTSLVEVESLVYSHQLTNVKVLKGIFPEQTAPFIRENKIRFCHIDVDVYNSAKDILEWLWPRLVLGGIVVYDDYGFKGCDRITKVVDEQVNLSDQLILHNLNGHAIMIKVK